MNPIVIFFLLILTCHKFRSLEKLLKQWKLKAAKRVASTTIIAAMVTVKACLLCFSSASIRTLKLMTTTSAISSLPIDLTIGERLRIILVESGKAKLVRSDSEDIQIKTRFDAKKYW